MNWKRTLAYISGSVDQELLLQNEYLVTENRILKNQIKGRLRLTDPERINLAEIGRRLGRKALEEVAQIVRPETILGWHRKLIAMKFDDSKDRTAVGLAPTAPVVEELVLHLARENRSWGDRRIAAAVELPRGIGAISEELLGLTRRVLSGPSNAFHIHAVQGTTFGSVFLRRLGGRGG